MKLKPLQGFIIMAVIFSCWIGVEPCSGQSLTICTSSPIELLDPTIHRDRNIQIMLKNMFDSLTTRDANMKVVPQLAESWKALNDTTCLPVE